MSTYTRALPQARPGHQPRSPYVLTHELQTPSQLRSLLVRSRASATSVWALRCHVRPQDGHPDPRRGPVEGRMCLGERSPPSCLGPKCGSVLCEMAMMLSASHDALCLPGFVRLKGINVLQVPPRAPRGAGVCSCG